MGAVAASMAEAVDSMAEEADSAVRMPTGLAVASPVRTPVASAAGMAAATTVGTVVGTAAMVVGVEATAATMAAGAEVGDTPATGADGASVSALISGGPIGDTTDTRMATDIIRIIRTIPITHTLILMTTLLQSMVRQTTRMPRPMGRLTVILSTTLLCGSLAFPCRNRLATRTA